MMAGPCEGDEGTGGLQEATLGASVSMISKREAGELLRMREPGGARQGEKGNSLKRSSRDLSKEPMQAMEVRVDRESKVEVDNRGAIATVHG